MPNGLGMGFVEGLTLFVPLSAVGDEVRVELREIKGKIGFARIDEILNSSDEREEPICGYFGNCGGCDFQHLSYKSQIAAKKDIILDCLKRIGKIDWNKEISFIESPTQSGYRMRAQWHLDTRSKTLGYFGRQTHEVVDVKNCSVLTPQLEGELNDLRNELNWDTFFAETVNVEVASGAGEQTSVYSPELLLPTRSLSFETKNTKYNFNARTFFQGNKFMIEALIDAAISDYTGGAALDLYSGVGLFSLPLARNFKRVIGIEENDVAVRFARQNALGAECNNIEFKVQRVSSALMGIAEAEDSYEFVLLDPPRSGAKDKTIGLIANLKPERISYVSCNPSTLARDLKTLLGSGYEISNITALDLFPQTHHVETVVHLARHV